MNYYELLDSAITLASVAHTGQTDKAGLPYILHPLHLMSQFDDPFMQICAVLHDVVEDTDVTLEQIELMFDIRIASVIDKLTHRKNINYRDYIIALSFDRISTKIKIEDLKHNMDYDRIGKIKQKDVNRAVKYLKAYKYLTTGAYLD